MQLVDIICICACRLVLQFGGGHAHHVVPHAFCHANFQPECFHTAMALHYALVFCITFAVVLHPSRNQSVHFATQLCEAAIGRIWNLVTQLCCLLAYGHFATLAHAACHAAAGVTSRAECTGRGNLCSRGCFLDCRRSIHMAAAPQPCVLAVWHMP